MKRCESCGLELPNNAQFCGNCGNMVVDRYATVTDFTNLTVTGISEPQTPPQISSPPNPNIQGSGMGWQETDSTFRTRWSFEEMESMQPHYEDRKTDENEAVLPDMLLPGMLAMRGQMPLPSQTPMVQGSPQLGAVPSVQGTPATPGNAPQSIPGPAHGAGSSAPSYAPQEPQSIPVHHQPVQHPWHQPPPHHYQPVHHPQTAPPTHELEHKHHHQHHTGPLHTHKPRTARLQRTATVTSKAGMGVASKWLIVIFAALVIIGSSSLLLAHELIASTPPPVLTISGTSVVRDGGVLHLHGQGFQPGDGVTLSFDNGLPVTLSGQHGTQAVSQQAEMNGQVAGFSQMNIAGALQLQSAATTNITVSSSGTFDVSITVPAGLPAGKHFIHATDNQNSQIASLQFTIPSSRLAVNPTALNFGSVEVGRKVQLSVTLSNLGGTSLLWTATVEGLNTNWLTLSNSSEVIGTNGLGQSVNVTADTNGLSVGSHTATLRFHSDNGYVQTAVNINVVSIAQSGQQAILNVPQQSLDFGQLQAAQQAQQSISIANLGNLALQWQASSDAASATWLTLATSKGTVQPGAVPQTVQVNVNTTGLVAGSYAGTITITSNGGNSQVKVTLVVTGSSVTPTPTVTPTQSTTPIQTPTLTPTQTPTSTPTQTPTPTPTQIPTPTPTVQSPPTPTPTPTPPVLTVATSGNCPIDRSGNYICTDTLTIAGSQGSIGWSVSAESDLPGTTFNPQNGTMTAGQSPQSVTVTIPGSDCPTYSGGHYDYSWTGSNTARVTFTCLTPTPTPTQPPPPPTLTVNPTGLSDLSGSPCTSATGGIWSCTVTVMETSNSQGNLTWSASSSLSGVSFSTSGSTLTPGQSVQVTISNIPCVSSGSFTFSGGAKPVSVSWNCGS